MLFCKNCGFMLDDNARFCTECGTPTENAQNTQNAQNETQNNAQNNGAQNGQNGYDPNNPYNPYNGYNPYNPYNGYYPPQPRKLDVGMLVFTIINFMLIGILAIWPLVYLLRARSSHNDAEEAYNLQKCKNANITCLVIGISITVFSFILTTIGTLLL